MMAPEMKSVLLRPGHTKRLRLRKRHLGSVHLISIKLFTPSVAKHQRKNSCSFLQSLHVNGPYGQFTPSSIL